MLRRNIQSQIEDSLIVIADDLLPNLEMLKSLLQTRNYRVEAVTTGQQAVLVTREQNPDLIISDIMMPEVDGFELCAVIKSTPELAHIPVILISALDDIGDIKRGFDAGAVDYITKPFRQQEVLARVRTHLELKHLRDEERQSAINQERQRIARELHDAVSQTLFSASMIAETLPRFIDDNPQQLRDGLHDLTLLTKGALAEMRTLLVELRPEALVQSELGMLIRNLVRGLRARVEATITYSVTCDDIVLPPAPKINIYRIAQESLNNVLKHAQATQVDVMLTCDSLVIADNGRGFDPAAVPSGHFGIRIMRERAQETRLALDVTSQPGAGTTITVTWRDANG